MDTKSIAEGLLAEVVWTGPDRGYCRCPGMELHTHRDARRDCRVMLDGAPTIHCVHSSCADVLADTNRKLRSAIGRAERGKQNLRWTPRIPSAEEMERRRQAEHERRLVERSRKSLARIITEHRVETAEFCESSPVGLPDDPREDWRRLLRLFPGHGVVWIGGTKDSCDETADEARKAYCRRHFRPVCSWLEEGRAPGQFTCPNLFKPGVHSRSNANVLHRPFLVVESDSLGKAEMMAVFAWMKKFLRLRAVVDTAGKSLHGWFDYPSSEQVDELRVILPALGFDKALFKASQPCRLPGAERGDRTQSLLWLDWEGQT